MFNETTARAGREFYTFDGRILEIFGSSPQRFHIRNTTLQVTGPDRKGRRTVVIAAGPPEARATQHTWHYSAEDWHQAEGLEALLETVQTAIASPRSPST